MTYEPSDTIGALTDAELATFLGEPWNGRIATLTPEGWPYVAPVWYEFERDRRAFLVVGRERAQWIAHLRVNPRVAFHVADDLHAQHTDPPPLAPLPGPRRPPVRRAHHRAPARAGAPGARELDHLDGARVAPALPVRRHTSLEVSQRISGCGPTCAPCVISPAHVASRPALAPSRMGRSGFLPGVRGW